MRLTELLLNRYRDIFAVNQDELSTTYISPNTSDTANWHLKTNMSVRNVNYTTYRPLMSIDAAEAEAEADVDIPEVRKLPTKTGIKEIISVITEGGKDIGGKRLRNTDIILPFHLYKVNQQQSDNSCMSLISSHHPVDGNNRFDYIIPGLLPIESQIEDTFTSVSNGQTQQAKFVAIGNPKMAVYDQQNTIAVSETIKQLLRSDSRMSSSHRVFSIPPKKVMKNNQSFEGSTNLSRSFIKLAPGRDKHTIAKDSFVTIWSKGELTTVLTANSGLLKKAVYKKNAKNIKQLSNQYNV
jgi:hypothetical protein